MKEETSLDKVLGISWDRKSDKFYFHLALLGRKAKGLALTRRNILSVLASLYDPLGIVSPLVVRVKMLFQDLCKEGVGWDEEIVDSRKKRWLEWVEDVERTNEIVVTRCVYGDLAGKPRCSLHGFADASMKAYCAVVYFVCELNESYHVEMLASKTRVAPIKTHTIPRLELMSARILAKLVAAVKTALDVQVEIVETCYWLDSKTALCWINNKGEWKQFVSHRVNEILKLARKEIDCKLNERRQTRK